MKYILIIIIWILSGVSYCAYSSENKLFNLNTMGYVRYGYLFDINKNEVNKCEQAKGAFAKSRFGNECEGFLEFQLKGELSLQEYNVDFIIGWDAVDIFGETPRVLYQDEKFIKVTQNKETSVAFWLGKRTYKRHEAHLLDYKYYHIKGNGLGVENIPFLSTHLSLAVFFSGDNPTDLRAYDLRIKSKTYQLGGLDNTFEFLFAKSVNELNSNFGKNRTSDSLGMIFNSDFSTSIFNKLVIKKTQGGFISHELPIVSNQPSDELSGFLMLDELLLEQFEWSLGMTYLYEVKNKKTSNTKWKSVGGRYIKYLTEHWNWVLDISFDHVKIDGIRKSKMHKTSLALQYSNSRGFYKRPVWRVFTSLISNKTNPISNKSNRMNFGIQYEHWW